MTNYSPEKPLTASSRCFQKHLVYYSQQKKIHEGNTLLCCLQLLWDSRISGNSTFFFLQFYFVSFFLQWSRCKMYNQRIMFWFCFCFCFTTNKGKRTGNVSARFQIPEASWRQLDPSKPAQGKLGSQKEGLFGSWKPCWSCYLRHQRQDNQISPLFPPSNFLAPPLFS